MELDRALGRIGFAMTKSEGRSPNKWRMTNFEGLFRRSSTGGRQARHGYPAFRFDIGHSFVVLASSFVNLTVTSNGKTAKSSDIIFLRTKLLLA
jgi:hypothetical protein